MSIQTLADIPERAITARDNQLLTWLVAVKVAAATHQFPTPCPSSMTYWSPRIC